MRKFISLSALVAALSLLGLMGLLLWGQGKMEPEYDDKPLRQLIEQFKSKDPDVRALAVAELGQSGLEAKAAVPDLANLLTDQDDRVRAFAAIALGAMGSEAKAAVPDLANLLTDRDEFVRDCAAAALGQIGPEAEAKLIEALDDSDPRVGKTAADALESIKKTRTFQCRVQCWNRMFERFQTGQWNPPPLGRMVMIVIAVMMITGATIIIKR